MIDTKTGPAPQDHMIDDMSRPAPLASNGAAWKLITDTVMGGVSDGYLHRETVAGHPAMWLQGSVRLENNGGFVQMTLDLASDSTAIDASGWLGLEIDVIGNDERYNLHLRTSDVVHPWQSWRKTFSAAPTWLTVRLPFDGFEAHRIDVPLNTSRLHRIGIVAIGRAFRADISVGGVRFYR